MNILITIFLNFFFKKSFPNQRLGKNTKIEINKKNKNEYNTLLYIRKLYYLFCKIQFIYLIEFCKIQLNVQCYYLLNLNLNYQVF